MKKTWLILITLIATFLSSGSLMAEPIGFMEKYALATDREAMLAELIPGSDDYYFYHCLHFQTNGQLDRSEATIKDWLALHKGRETALISSMLDRQRLLTYNESPQRTIDYLIKRLGVNHNHAPPVTKGERRFPSEFDNALLDPERLIVDALNQNDSLKPLGMTFVAERFRNGKTAGLKISLHDFLKRVNGAYIVDLDELVIKELKQRKEKDKRFGDVAAHNFLTLDELDRVAKAVPQVSDDNHFVNARLLRLRPDEDSDPSQLADVRLDYLKRVEAYTRTLPESYNSLKACATYRLLEANLAANVYDKELFLRYLQLPRNSPIVHVVWARRRAPKANLGQNFMDVALLSPIGNEQNLVRVYLEQFLRGADDGSEFETYLRPEFLRQVLAETKLMAGVGNPDQWYKILSATQRQAIRDAVTLQLAPQNKIRFAKDDPTQLIVDVKNMNELLVRIYEINTLAYYRSHDKPLNTDIDLDGLAPTAEKKYTFNQPAVERHRETLDLSEEINGRGVWVVDLVGKGVRARAMIRRGELHHIDQNVADGMVFTIVDENSEPIAGATMLVGSHEFVSDEEGRIGLPPVANNVQRSAILSDGRLAEKVNFKHLRESYRLDAGMHIDRTHLQSGGDGRLLIKPRLSMSGEVIDADALSDISLLIHATDLEGLNTTVQLENLKLSQKNELEVPFRVPPRLVSLSVTLSGKVAGLANGRNQTVQTDRTWDIAGIRRTNYTHDVFLTRDGDNYLVEARGRTGEPVAGATVNITLHTELRNRAVEQTLQTDDKGQVKLGNLRGGVHIRYRVPGGMSHSRDLILDRVVWPSEIHSATKQDLQLPLAEVLDDAAKRYRLLELRSNQYHLDRTADLSINAGMLTIKPLAPGDYHLIDRETNAKTRVVVVNGRMHGLVVSGRTRHRSVSPTKPLGIESIERNDEGIRIKLSGETTLARVHVYGRRYLDSPDPMPQMALPMPSLRGRSVSLPRCGYVSGMRLGDEYQYVLRRRYADKYPGVMLPQPTVILNPWETQETSNSTQTAAAGDAPKAAAMAAPGQAMQDAMKRMEEQAAAQGSDYDFLADPGVLVSNLVADENGVVSIPKKIVDGLPILQIVVSDPTTMMQRTLTAPLGETETVDLRLAETLEIEKPLSFERAVSVVSKDKPLDLASLGSAQIQVYPNVGSLFKLYKTLVRDSRLDEFDDIAMWHKYDQEAKIDAYTRLASHEFHLFLWAHDREFFDATVRPYLQNKKEKQFLDHWLLENDLASYVDLWKYNQLNAAERAMLAMRVPDVRESIRRELQEVVQKQDENHQAVRKQIESALIAGAMVNFSDMNGDGLEEMEALGFDVGTDRYARDSGVDHEQKIRRLSRQANERLSESAEFKKSKSKKASRPLSLGRGAISSRGGGMGGIGGGGFGFAGKAYSFYQELDATKQWAESNWDHVRTVGGPSPASLIGVNPFWADLAMRDPGGQTISDDLLRPVQNRHSALIALAMCGLPLKAGDVGLPTEEGEAYAPEHAVAVVTKRLRPLAPNDKESSILVGQRFARADAKPKKGKAIAEPKEFLVGTAFKGQTVISNPTGQQQVVDVFWQIPAGSLPLAGSQVTDSKTITLEPFAVQSIEYQFYFPKAGDFVHYPATIASEGVLLARGTAKQFKAVDQETEDDSITWEKVARTGSADQMRDFLAEANLREIDWMLVAHRMGDEAIYKTIVSVLDSANLPVMDLWAYSLKHRDEAAMKEYLSMSANLVNRVGPVLKSSLLEVEPIERRTHEHLEYAPLVRARIHRLGKENEILNGTFLQQYRSFVRMLGFSKESANEEKLALTYYLLLQNRIKEAIDTFATIKRDAVVTKIQFDYVDAYLALHGEEYDKATKIATGYVEHPIPRWNSRFREIVAQMEQRRALMENQQLVSVDKNDDAEQKPIAEGSGDLALLDRQRRQAIAAEDQPEVIVRVEGDALRIDHRRAKEVVVNLYGVDLELLFSKAPFVREQLQRMAMVRPMRTDTVAFDSPTGVGKFELDNELKRQTLLVEVTAGGSRSTALYYGGEITTYVSESYGQLQTTDAKTHRPISKAYVKVYGRYPDGSVKFYKDGYTDSRGRFDYTSISAAEARGATRYAILVLSEDKGATLHDVATPNQ